MSKLEKIEEIYHAALERAPREREAFLRQVCGGDDELRREVDSLLSYDEQAAGFIEAPPDDLAAALFARPANRDIVGRELGHYRVLSVLGAGGMGEVYLATDTKLGRQAALKLLPPQFSQNAERKARFEQEARAASALNHPNIITIYGVEQAEGHDFIATEFIDGQTLRERLADKPFSPQETVDIALQVAGALAAAHSVGIVHRDIKPANIMLRRDGYVKVLDFGLAKLTLQSADSGNFNTRDQTGPRRVMGTINYMSPEQALGEKLDARTDIFSLGVVLYEMLAGMQPFAGPSDAAVYNAIINRQPPVLRAAGSALPPVLEQIISRALAKDRAARYQTAAELQQDLQQLKQNSASVGRFAASWPPSRAKLLIPLTAALLLAVAAFVYVKFLRSPATPPGVAQNYTFTQFTANGTAAAPSFAPDGKTVVFASADSGNRDIYFQRVGGTNALNLTKDSTADDTQPAMSPNGEMIVFRSERDGGGLFLMGATGENTRKVAASGYYPAWSPDGKEIVYCSAPFEDPTVRRIVPSALWVLNIASGEKRELTKGDAVQPSWSPNGDRIAFWGLDDGGNRDIKTVARNGGESVPVTNDAALDWNPVWSRNGKHLYFASNRGGSMNFWRVPIDEKTGRTNGSPEPFTVPSVFSQDLAFTPDGKQLAFVQKAISANLMQTEFNPLTATVAKSAISLTSGARINRNPAVSPDGEWIAFDASKDKQEDLFIIKRDGTNLRQLTNDTHKDRYAHWSPDGKRLLFFSNRSGDYQSWSINSDGSGLTQLSFGPNELLSIWSPDGKKLVQSYFQGYPKVFATDQALTAQTPFQIPAYAEAVGWGIAYAWSSDGGKIAGTRMGLDKELSGVFIYDLTAQKYLPPTNFGAWPVWLNDNRRLLFTDKNKAFLYDIVSAQTKEIMSLTPTESFQSLTISPDNRVLYYSLDKSETNIWLASVE